MPILVDTSVWSLLLRRKQTNQDKPLLLLLKDLLQEGVRIWLIGPVIQELLDGLKSQEQFDKLEDYLGLFGMIDLTRSDYVEAARMRNYCRSKGVQASPVDFIIARACLAKNLELLTADKDFQYISQHIPLKLASP